MQPLTHPSASTTPHTLRRKHRRRRRLLRGVLCLCAVIGAVTVWLSTRTSGADPVVPDPLAYPVRGIDVSAHNGEIDFTRVAGAGVEFVLIKATEGCDFKDRAFADNLKRARAAGLAAGAYHFFRFDRGGYEQALNLLHSVRGRTLDLPLVIDVEEWANPKFNTTADILTRLQTMVNTLEAHGYDVMLYSNKDGFDRFLGSRFAHYPLWICSFTGRPSTSRLRLWQYTHSGRIDGVEGKVDINVYAGSRYEWEQWLDNLGAINGTGTTLL
ncbi:MAG: hypothetical protein NC187_04175 [Candidatus Amulumruptor caecigallinarius]|nr:hypothetical protein [Candidatus Amulumruptor caecigallinarius]MCM1396669.1 hypothetical protein [Candidatus Amulumruptor caecigallinarius]MCM1453273.1 lysozyme [bacterium]